MFHGLICFNECLYKESQLEILKKNVRRKAIKICWLVLGNGKEHFTTSAAVGTLRVEIQNNLVKY